MTHEELVERVARAIFEHWQFQKQSGAPSDGSAPVKWVPSGNSFKQEEARDYARAAIDTIAEALKEPTPEMLAAFWRYKNGHHYHDEEPPTDRSDYGAYAAMIKASEGK